MSGVLAVAQREVREHRVVLVAAAVASLGALAAPLVAVGTHAALARSVTAFLGATVFAAGIAVGLGATTLAPGMATRRIGFDFSRPLSASAIWTGRLAGAMLLAAGAALILWIPSWIAGARAPWNDLWIGSEPPAAWPLLALGAFAGLFALAHCAALALRSRSGLIALDAALGVLCGFLAWAAFVRLPVYHAEAPRLRLAVGLAVSAGIACLGAGYASVVRGRTDARTGHRALSSVLWTVMGAAVLCANGYAAWVTSAGPSAIAENGFWFRPADRGPWLDMTGWARGARAEMLYDTGTGRFERIGTIDWRGAALSGNGTRAAWIEVSDRGGPHALRTLALDDANAKPVATRLLFEGYPSLLELSEDGASAATWENGVLAVHDLASGRTLVSAKVPLGDREEIRGLFVDRNTFRAYRVGDSDTEILQLDAETRRLQSLGKIEAVGGRYFGTNASGSRLLTVGHGIHLYDGATGVLLATLAEDARFRWPWMLADGRIVMTEDASRLRVFDADGRGQSSIALPPDCGSGSKVAIGGEVAPDQLVVGCTAVSSKRSIWLANLRDGSTRKVADGLSPVWAFGARPAVGSDATKLFYGAEGRSLVRMDPLTGQRNEILGGRR